MSVSSGAGGGHGGVPVFRSAHSRGDDGTTRKPPVRRRAPRAKKQPIELTAFVSVPHNVVGFIIGKNGHTVKQIQASSGAQVWATVKPEDAAAHEGPVDIRVYGSARSVIEAAHQIAAHLATCQAFTEHATACRLEFAGNAVCGQLTVCPADAGLYDLFQTNADAPVKPVAILSEVDVSISEEHVEAAIDDAVFVHGGFAGQDVDAWIAGEPRRLYAWSLTQEGANEVLSSLQGMMNEGTEDVRSPLENQMEIRKS